MKKFLKSAGLPIGVFALAIGSAFATNAMKNADPNDRIGYLYDEQQELCLPKADCTLINTGTICTWKESTSSKVEHNLFDYNGTSCEVKLYQKM